MRTGRAAAVVVACLIAPEAPRAQPPLATIADDHIAPRYRALAEAAAGLSGPATACDVPRLTAAYHATFDAWVAVQHVAFGPVEDGDARFAIAFWPDAKNFAGRGLQRLERAEDPIVDDPAEFAKASVAVRGLLALERLLVDDDAPLSGYRCRLAQAIATDLAQTTRTVADGWTTASPLTDQTDDAALRDLFRSLDSGLEFLTTQRFGRPMGVVGAPRPRRAEGWRSGRSVRNIHLSLGALRAFHEAAFAPALPETLRDDVAKTFERAETVAARLPDGFDALRGGPSARLRFEAAQSRIADLQRLIRAEAAPVLGVVIGFNALDGD